MQAPCCDCGVKVAVQISHSPQNPNCAFYTCSMYISRGKKSCSFFKWVDVYATEIRAQELSDMVANLRLNLDELEQENMRLRSSLRNVVSEQASPSMAASSSGLCELNVSRELRNLKQRVTRVERFLGLE